LLIDPNPTSALNEEAGKLLLEDYPSYCSHARLFTEVHAMKPKPLVIPARPAPKSSQSSREESNQKTSSGSSSREEPKSRNTSGSSIPLASSQAQNAPPDPETKPKLLLFGLGVKRSDAEDGENRPAKRSQGFRRAGKGDLRRL
jgi:ubiquitin-conjugating enzyme E2 S